MKKRCCFLFFLLLLGAIALVGCGENGSGKKTINVGTNAEFPPFEYMNNEGEIDGFDMAVIKAIAEEKGYDVKFTNMEFKSLPASLKTGALDVVAAGMTITEDRKKNVDFSNGYYEANQCIIVRKDSKIANFSDLEGKSIAVQEGTTGDLMVTPGAEDSKLKKASVKRFKKGSDAIIELKNAGVDAMSLS